MRIADIASPSDRISTSAPTAVRTYALIDAGAIAHNLAQVRRRLSGARPRIWATAKSDAYGHGLTLALPGLREADGIAVQSLAEAHTCRAAGWNGPVLVYAGLLDPQECALLDQPDLHLVITHMAQLDWLASAKPAVPPAVWLRYTGDIHLGGFGNEDYPRAYARCTTLVAEGRIGSIGHLNHYSHAEDENGIAKSEAGFRRAIDGLPGPVSTCNSAALLRHPAHAAETDWVRPGLLLYGASPLAETLGPGLGLRPAMTLVTRLACVQTLAAGANLGYCAAFTAPRDMRVGLVACGYADGYPRHARTGTPVLVNGRRTRLLGRPTMDTLAVDLDGIEDAVRGCAVVLWGDGLPVEEVAASAGTIAAELLTGLTPRVPLVGR